MKQELYARIKPMLAKIVGIEVVLIDQIWDDFKALRPFWPILIPVVLWYGARTYRRERLAAQAAAAALKQADSGATAGQ